MNHMRRRCFRPGCEDLEGRRLLSAYYIVNAASGKATGRPRVLHEQRDPHPTVSIERGDQSAVEAVAGLMT